jgi:hypothetical protein
VELDSRKTMATSNDRLYASDAGNRRSCNENKAKPSNRGGDRFSKYAILIPSRTDDDTEVVFQLLWEKVFSVFGIPETITSDRDKIFRSKKWITLMRLLRCQQILSTSNHQQTDGQTERKIQEIHTYFRNYLDFNQKNWAKMLPVAQYALNDAINATTGQTPSFVVFGTRRQLGWDIPTEPRKSRVVTKMRLNTRHG